MQLVDTHCHLTFEDFGDSLDAVLERSVEAGVTGWITVGTSIEDSGKAVRLAQKYDNMYAAVGIHPHDAKNVTDADICRLAELAEEKKVVAVGETGLDFHYNFSSQEAQKKVFINHIELAAKTNLPIIVHSRNAFDETLDILEKHGSGIEKIVFHCFVGDVEQARILLERGYFISFTGVVTFKNAEKTRQAAAAVPAERIMLETDCPYMSPVPMRNVRPNEPALMVHIAKLFAEIKGLPLEQFADITSRTSRAFFGF
ncbi:MAG: TatD family hydrolase [Phycisphaerae bacterium]|nr:TatD family hydrolase [Phycisphaerae bacterium]